MRDATAAGPFDYWPTQRGFDRWYGFHGGYTDSWHPELYDGNQRRRGATRGTGYHLTDDLIDHAIEYVRDQQGAARSGRSSSTWPWGLPLAAPRPRPRTSRSTGVGTTVAGTSAAGVAGATEGAGDRAARRRAAAADPDVPPWDDADARRAAGRRPPDGGLRRLPGAHRRPDRAAGGVPGGDRPARQHAARADLRQRRQPEGGAARRVNARKHLPVRARDARRRSLPMDDLGDETT